MENHISLADFSWVGGVESAPIGNACTFYSWILVEAAAESQEASGN
jgi:hypothetical protein